MAAMVDQRASKRQQELLSFVDGFIKGNGYGPSYREIMRALDYKSVSTVATHIENLITKGYLARRDNSARSLQVVSLRPGEQLVNTLKNDSDIEATIIERLNNTSLNDEQRQAAVNTFELLNMKRVSDAIKSSIETETAS